jgi:hypothetical protein
MLTNKIYGIYYLWRCFIAWNTHKRSTDMLNNRQQGNRIAYTPLQQNNTLQDAEDFTPEKKAAASSLSSSGCCFAFSSRNIASLSLYTIHTILFERKPCVNPSHFLCFADFAQLSVSLAEVKEDKFMTAQKVIRRFFFNVMGPRSHKAVATKFFQVFPKLEEAKELE